MPDDDPPRSERTVVSISLGRLAVPRAPAEVPTWEDLGLMALAEECVNWQLLRTDGTLWEFNATTNLDCWREVALLMWVSTKTSQS